MTALSGLLAIPFYARYIISLPVLPKARFDLAHSLLVGNIVNCCPPVFVLVLALGWVDMFVNSQGYQTPTPSMSNWVDV